MKIKQAVILAGGRGTRLRPITDTLPKPMIPFHGKPFVEYLIEMLREEGIEEVVLLLGYLSDVVQDYFGNGEKVGVRIRYSVLPLEAETGARMKEALPILDENFLMMYCDNYWPLSLKKLTDFYIKMNCAAVVTVYHNEDGYTKNNVKVSPDGIMKVYDKSRTTEGLQGVDIGYAIFSRKVVAELPDDNPSFERETYNKLVSQNQLAAYVTRHRYYSVGSHERLAMTENFLRRKPAIFIDRDGTLNQKAPRGEYICSPDTFIWLPGALSALEKLTRAGYQIFIITNQAGIARGSVTQEGLEAIHAKMIREIEEAGGHIDGIYICPHHWDENCDCRKPKPGMLFKAQREYDLDLSRVWFLGDDERDLEAGNGAGCKVGLVTEQQSLMNWVQKILDQSNSRK